MSQIGALVVLNLVIGFGFGTLLGTPIDNAAHVGGLVAGLWLGFVLPPVRSTLASYWQRPAAAGAGGAAGAPGASGTADRADRAIVGLRVLAVLMVPLLVVAVVLVGGAAR